jgi:Cu(I)/Ag(I) efflux system membrane fusion protein
MIQRNRFTIPARIGGRLEKVFLKYPYQSVSKGQIVAEIYSAELATAQQELLWLLQQDDNEQEIQQAKDKLVLLGFTEPLLANLIQSKAVQYRFPIISPVSGFVIIGEQPQPTIATQSNMGMQANAAIPQANNTDIIKEGDYVNAGATLFSVVDANSLLIELSVSLEQSKNISVGDTVNLKLKQIVMPARVGFIQPFYNSNQEFALVRIYVPGANLKIGELVTAQWSTKTSAWMWLPRQAVVDLGTEAIVFVKERGSFVAKQVVIQSSTSDKIALTGLSSMDEIALNAQFLVDSEGFIRTSK